MTGTPLRARNHGRLTSGDQGWRTPPALFAALDAEFSFTLDAAADAGNALCARHFDARTNALWQRWDGGGGAVWVNPPYHGNLPRFMEKAYLAALGGATVVCLVPSRTDVRWWHRYVMRASEIRFVRGRLSFSEAGPAPFASAVVVFRPPLEDVPPRIGSLAL